MSPQTLQPEDEISHYRIVSSLGAGGMGEVYLAQDRTLERSVALKILPPELVRSEDRVRRFVREAKSASSLNHPNIVTIYEIGQDEVRGHGGPAAAGAHESSAVHFISMELVSGSTLSTKIHQDKTDLRTLLGYLAQAAEGLAKAHAAGIVHRDLKPGNIMISKDGFAKILDFGLAKLTEKASSDADVTSGPTDAGEGTAVGAVVGTVGYMSPEQVRGGTVDHRSDIFSFGSILYEAATRRKPFSAESGVETMHQILHDKPAPIEELNKEAPAELRRLIRRCMAKNPEQRLQSAKDLAIELREIVDEYEELSRSGSSGAGSSAAGMAAAGSMRKGLPPAALIAGALLLGAAFMIGIFMLKRGGERSVATPPQLRISAATSGRGNAFACDLSPDGRYLAYVQQIEGMFSLWVRQVATGSDVQVLAPQKDQVRGLRFTPDGNYLYYLSSDPDHEGYNGLFEIPTLGGTPRKRAYDIDSRPSFAPDGKRLCFYRGMPQKNKDGLILLDLDSGEERELASVSPPVTFFPASPTWSPDGKRVAIVESRGNTNDAVIATYRVEDGRREAVGKPWIQLLDLEWLPDGKGFVVSTFDRATLQPGQLSIVAYPSGETRKVTSDANIYVNPSVSRDGATLAAVRFKANGNLWVTAPSGHPVPTQLTFNPGDEGGLGTITPGPDSTTYFSLLKDGSVGIWAIQANGSNQQRITQGSQNEFSPTFVQGKGLFFVRVEKDLTLHVWRSDPNGDNARQMTTGNGEQIGAVSPDHKTLVVQHDDDQDHLWTMSTDGGDQVGHGRASRESASFSRDGTRILYTLIHTVDGRGTFTPVIASASDTTNIVPVPLPPRSQGMELTPDGMGVTYVHPANGQRNLMRLDLASGKSTEVTHFTDGRITQYRWSRDAKLLLLRRRTGNVDNLWVAGADGSHPIAVTDFETGQILDQEWSLDGNRIYFTYGTSGQDVVLVRNFR